ncbi:hemerythrin domain-containing protein [Streptomyces sp. NPDC006197]|uniref:hemerythrin domain-containing protein n=1 Tax=Streptomyces sp. NPDC006197 TaxID=3156685 RepID=UPI0033B0DE53
MGNSGIVGELSADHQGIQQLVDQVRAAPPGSAERASLVEQLSGRLVGHLVTERAHLLPLVRRHVADGDEWVNRFHAEDRELQQTLATLRDTAPHGERYMALLLSVVTAVTRHVVEMEQLLFPRLQATAPATALRDAAAEARETAAVAPTRPRPCAPGSPALTKLSASFWGPWDRFRDRLTHRGRRS